VKVYGDRVRKLNGKRSEVRPPMNQSTYHAVYSDGGTYAVVYDPKERKTYLATTDGGFMSVPYLVNDASFVRYGFDYAAPKGLRGCDWATNVGQLHAHLALLTPPAKPTPPTPVPQAPEDFRVHVEAGDSFRVLQEVGAKATTQYRNSRQRARQEMLAQLNQPNAQKIQEVRRIQGEYAAQKRPRGGGEFIVKNQEE